jgi:tetratricopeptide (TPR) repeat protein
MTGKNGGYIFPAMPAGKYVLRGEKIGYIDATVDPLTILKNESKSLDLTLASAKASAMQKSSDAGPAFFDEPHFTVAGVTDTTNLGGHGSDTVVRNREALAKDTASLSIPAYAPANAATAAAEKQLHHEVERQPSDFGANYRLGKFLVEGGKAGEGITYLVQASQVKPGDYDAGYELALARAGAGDYHHARADILAILNSRDYKAEAHHLLAAVSEKLSQPLDAVREYQRAAELDPNEAYLFDWGAELLLHHAAQPAVEVFTNANRLFPKSARILTGLGTSWYALGSYDNGVQRLCEASDLNPEDPNPYLFLGKIQAVEPEPRAAITERLERFVTLQPENAMANYYYAVTLWKGRKSPEDVESLARVRSLLEKSTRIDPNFGPSYLQLGILYSEQKDFPNAIATYQNAIHATPDMEQAHYRLSQAYRQVGETSKSQSELRRYEQISKEKSAETERQRHQVQQFVYELQEPAVHAQPQ